jgi:hypothetical protein
VALVYTTAAGVQARVPGRTIGASTKPTTTEVETWLYEGEAYLKGALSAGGIDAPTAGTDGGKLMTTWATDFAEARVRMSWASTAGDENKDGQSILDRFDKIITDIYENPGRYQAMLNAGAANTDTVYVRGANTDSTADDYVDVEFERDREY